MIPLPRFVVEELRRHPHGDRRVIQLFSQGVSGRTTKRPDNLIGQRYTPLAQSWNVQRCVPLSDLRNTLLNTARRNHAWPVRLVEQFVGHVDSSVTGKHYQSDEPEELFLLFKNGIMPLLNDEIEKAIRGTKWPKNGTKSGVFDSSNTARIVNIVAVG
ncbi:hypothetical protein BH09SUM1_BH09SUM1_19150 [soil metagenome]